ncbi:hypothetical protein D3C83_111010 [compost metagenome]
MPIKDSAALARAITKLLNDENLRSEFGKYSRLKVEREFSEHLIVQKTLAKLYEIPLASA